MSRIFWRRSRAAFLLINGATSSSFQRLHSYPYLPTRPKSCTRALELGSWLLMSKSMPHPGMARKSTPLAWLKSITVTVLCPRLRYVLGSKGVNVNPCGNSSLYLVGYLRNRVTYTSRAFLERLMSTNYSQVILGTSSESIPMAGMALSCT